MKLLSSARFMVIAVLIWQFIFTRNVWAQNWYFPMVPYKERIQVKDFGTFVDDKFYQGKEGLFPYNRFYGYHAGVDLEILGDKEDKKIPVYAVASGKIIYIGSLSGYGGVILQKLDGESLTVLYGHVKITNLPYRLNDRLEGGTLLTYLGDAFSNETSKERKHLHFGIYKGTGLYFHGHEAGIRDLESHWIDPTKFLESKGAILPQAQALPTSAKNYWEIFSNLVASIKNFLLAFSVK